MLHGQIQRRGCLPTTADPDQHHISQFQIAGRLTVVVLQREIDRLNTVVVLAVHTRSLNRPTRWLDFILNSSSSGLHEGLITSNTLPWQPLENVKHIVIGQRGEHDRPLSLAERLRH